MTPYQRKRYFANKARFEKQGYQNELSRNDIIARAEHSVDDRRAFENLSLNGRYKQENRERFKKLAQKHSDQANMYLDLAYHFKDKKK